MSAPAFFDADNPGDDLEDTRGVDRARRAAQRGCPHCAPGSSGCPACWDEDADIDPDNPDA